MSLNPMSLTLDDLRAEAAQLLDLAPEALGAEDNLYDLGLDSMRLMGVVMALEAQGHSVDYGALMEAQTLTGWAKALGI